MNSDQQHIEPTLLIHALYVAFVFSCLFFGALAFRQVLDNLTVKRLHMGEDRDGFVDARAIVLLGWMLPLALVVSILVQWGVGRATIFSYALPMILFLQVVQLTIRTLLQRTIIKTHGIIVRSVLFGEIQSAPFNNIIMVRFERSQFWVSVYISLPSEQITFRIFLFSAEQLQRMIAASCTAPILWISSKSQEHDVHPPTSSL